MESQLSDLLSTSPRKRLQTAVELLVDLADMDAVPLATPKRRRRSRRMSQPN